MRKDGLGFLPLSLVPCRLVPAFSLLKWLGLAVPVGADVRQGKLFFADAGVSPDYVQIGGADDGLVGVDGDDARREAGFEIDVDIDGGEFVGELGAGLGGEAQVQGAGEIGFIRRRDGDVELLVDFFLALANGQREGALAEFEQVDFIAGLEDLADDFGFASVIAVGEPPVGEEVFDFFIAGGAGAGFGIEEDMNARLPIGFFLIVDHAAARGSVPGGGVFLGHFHLGGEILKAHAVVMEYVEGGIDGRIGFQGLRMGAGKYEE